MDGYYIYGLWGYDDQMNIVEMKSSYKLKDGETGYNGIDDYIYLQGSATSMCATAISDPRRVPRWHLSLPFPMMNGEGDMGFPYFCCATTVKPSLTRAMAAQIVRGSEKHGARHRASSSRL